MDVNIKQIAEQQIVLPALLTGLAFMKICSEIMSMCVLQNRSIALKYGLG